MFFFRKKGREENLRLCYKIKYVQNFFYFILYLLYYCLYYIFSLYIFYKRFNLEKWYLYDIESNHTILRQIICTCIFCVILSQNFSYYVSNKMDILLNGSVNISIPWYALQPQFSISPTEWSRLSNVSYCTYPLGNWKL